MTQKLQVTKPKKTCIKTERLLNTRGNHQQNENTTYLMGENIYNKGLISKHRRNSYNSIAKKKKLMGKEPEKTFPKRRHTNGQEVHEKVLCISNHQRNTNQNHNIFIYLQ